MFFGLEQEVETNKKCKKQQNQMQDRWKQWKNNNHKFETRQKFLFLCFLRTFFSFFCRSGSLRSPNGTETWIHCSNFKSFLFRLNRKLFAVSVAKSWITEMCSFSINVMAGPKATEACCAGWETMPARWLTQFATRDEIPSDWHGPHVFAIVFWFLVM